MPGRRTDDPAYTAGTMPNTETPPRRGLEFKGKATQGAFYGSSRRADDDRHCSGNYAGLSTDNLRSDGGEEWRGNTHDTASHFDENHNHDRHARESHPGSSTAMLGREGGRGYGPSSVKRADHRIKEDIAEALGGGPVDGREVEVSVADGHVTLTGRVAHRREKQLVEELIEGVRGVREVTNALRVVPLDLH